MRSVLVAAVLAATLPSVALATGFMMPSEEGLECLRLESHRVTAEIRGQAAVTTVKEVFLNQHDRQLEAQFIFPLPKDAAVTDFKMYVNGKLVTGEIKDAGEARRIYQSIVSRMRDPGLLEYMDSKMLRLSVFPIPPHGKQEVELRYSQTLDVEGGLVEYVYPLKTPQKAAATLQDFTLSVDIRSDAGVRNVYSPTHDVTVRALDDRHATAGFEKSKASLDSDFRLYYQLSDKEFGASVISYKPDGKDGYFLLLVSPKIDVAKDKIAAKDVAFVIDVSGSMSGEKMDQARKALEFCVTSLRDGDRFTIITFSDAVEELPGGLLDATTESRTKAKEFISRIAAGGGTDIHGALLAALKHRPEGSRPFNVVFLTDGLPTVGQTDAGKILSDVREKNTSSTRIFSFGVGYDVNTKLLDELSRTTNASNSYVHPDEDIEVKVSGFFTKIGDPLLASVEVDYGAAEVRDVLPRKMPDLFRGSQLSIAGRYGKAGQATIVLRGDGPDGKRTFEYPVTFASADETGRFVTGIWASRKIGHLLNEMRLSGEKDELKNEVVKLSKEYGIVTPYTSYLVTDGSEVPHDMPQPIRRRLHSQAPALEQLERLDSLGYIGAAGGGAARDMDMLSAASAPSSKSYGYAETGRSAVTASEAAARLAGGDKAAEGALLRSASGRTFANMSGVWVETGLPRDAEVVAVKFASEAYFRLVESAPSLLEALSLGETVVLKAGSYILAIDALGISDADDAKLQEVLKALR